MHPDMDLVLPFSVAADNDELEKNINSFDWAEYDEKLEEFHKSIGLVFNGNASKKLADKLEEMM